MIHEFAVELLLNELSTFITNRLEALEEETSPKIRGRTLAFRAQLTNIYATLVERFSFDSFDESARTRSAEYLTRVMVVIKRLREEEEELHIALFRGCFCRIVEVASGVDENLRKEMFQILARWSGYAGNSRGAVDIEMYSSEMSAFLGRSVAGKLRFQKMADRDRDRGQHTSALLAG